MIWMLVLQLMRPYHVETIASMPTCRHTHVAVTGRVILVRKEADGDIHIRISDDGKRFVVGEIIPTLMRVERPFANARNVAPQDQTTYALPIQPPKLNECVELRGIRRFDNEAGHGFWEIHPIEQLTVVACP